jgi:hypothetical protein
MNATHHANLGNRGLDGDIVLFDVPKCCMLEVFSWNDCDPIF